MKLGIVGLEQSGKQTVFAALTRTAGDPSRRADTQIGTIQVPDDRVDFLSRMYNPKKTIYAQVEYSLPGRAGQKGDGSVWTRVRDCDALIHVVRNFSAYGLPEARPESDLETFDQELILADLVVVEKRLERLTLDKRRGKKIDEEEAGLLERCRLLLEAETPLRRDRSLAAAPVLRGFAFLSAKPMLVLVNNGDEDDALPASLAAAAAESCLVIKGKLEQELGQMSAAEANDFLAEFNITASAMDRVIGASYEVLGLISFFTVGEDEVRAWTLRRGTEALDAAEVIHSDIKKGFIRAEVLAYADLVAAGTFAEARKRGTVRLEGKTYPVQDGDIITFRFNV